MTGPLFWRGVPMKNLLMYYMGLEEGGRFPDGCNVLPIAITIGTITITAGSASARGAATTAATA